MKFQLGYDTHWDEGEDKGLEYPALHGDADFVVCHCSPNETVELECARAGRINERFSRLGVDFVANFEFQNWADHRISADGHDWSNTQDGGHRLNLPDEYVKAFSAGERFLGIMYDEMEHALINRNLSLTLKKEARSKLPVFPLTETDDPVEVGEDCRCSFAEYADRLFKNGAPNFAGEHVFPVLYHILASCGIIPNFKSQKESYSNVQYAVAAGAALEYGTPLWNCVDLWYRNTFPGHSPREMYHNLLFAYLAGVDRAYVENSGAFFDKKGGGEGYNEYGREFERFAREYKGRERGYRVGDYLPETGIVRYDDTFWGQCDPIMWQPILFGNDRIKPDRRAREWLRAFHTITHGETNTRGLSWDRISPWSLRKHRSFASMNGAAVFDEKVKKETLASLKLCFLCGYFISPETLAAVEELVRENGLVVVTSKRFAPKHIAQNVNGGFCDIPDGKGRWIVTSNFASRRVKKAVAPFLGKKGEMTYRFGGETVRMKISDDGEAFEML